MRSFVEKKDLILLIFEFLGVLFSKLYLRSHKLCAQTFDNKNLYQVKLVDLRFFPTYLNVTVRILFDQSNTMKERGIRTGKKDSTFRKTSNKSVIFLLWKCQNSPFFQFYSKWTKNLICFFCGLDKSLSFYSYCSKTASSNDKAVPGTFAQVIFSPWKQLDKNESWFRLFNNWMGG